MFMYLWVMPTQLQEVPHSVQDMAVIVAVTLPLQVRLAHVLVAMYYLVQQLIVKPMWAGMCM
jgi:hypothetical protein